MAQSIVKIANYGITSPRTIIHLSKISRTITCLTFRGIRAGVAVIEARFTSHSHTISVVSRRTDIIASQSSNELVGSDFYAPVLLQDDVDKLKVVEIVVRSHIDGGIYCEATIPR